MTITIDEATIGEDGTLRLPQEVLDALGTRKVRLEVEAGRVVLAPKSRLLQEIADPEERWAAYLAFKAQIMRPGGGALPTTRAELNELVYD